MAERSFAFAYNVIIAGALVLMTSSAGGLDVNIAFMTPSSNNTEGMDVSVATSVPALACAVETIERLGILSGVNLK